MTAPLDAAASDGAVETGEVLAAALAGHPLMSTTRLRSLLAAHADVEGAWRAVVDGRAARVVDLRPGRGRSDTEIGARWAAAASVLDLAGLDRRLRALGVRVRVLGGSGYPPRLAADHDPPAVLFERSADGSLSASSAPTAAIVGTRRCTSYGREVAAELGRDLSSAGVSVISGLALGIDGAAHEGALVAGAAPPVAVVGSGLDVVYPRRHERLWHRVAAAGAVIGEAPLGAAPEAFRFPLRNRIIAALADVVVVVESHATGGSMHTVQSAIERGVPVMAVPGSVRSPSSAGANRLLADGVAPVLDATDVLVALSLSSPGAGGAEPNPPAHVDGADAAVLEAVGWEPTPTERVLQRTGLDLGAAASALTRLEMAGLVRSSGGAWERCGGSR
ncbi:MAG TPA: DNA-processing protein DprA [Acidimicrobiales bacterium]|nr:DNA-processing protein DprA [Acidimicrobiales bacterium]